MTDRQTQAVAKALWADRETPLIQRQIEIMRARADAFNEMALRVEDDFLEHKEENES